MPNFVEDVVKTFGWRVLVVRSGFHRKFNVDIVMTMGPCKVICHGLFGTLETLLGRLCQPCGQIR